MKPTQLLAIAAIALAANACTTVTGETNSYAIVKEGVPGGEAIETSTIKATVTNIDAAKRKLTLVTPSSEKFNVTAGPDVVNFDQIKIGDQLLATVTEQVIIRMAKPGDKLNDTEDLTVGVAPVGAKPGMSMKETTQIVATVTAIDHKSRKVTLGFSDGSSKKVKARKDIDLTQHKVGDKVVFRSTETFAVKIEKP